MYVGVMAKIILNSLLACGKFCHLLMIYANILDPDQNGGPDLDPSRLTLMLFMRGYFSKK